MDRYSGDHRTYGQELFDQLIADGQSAWVFLEFTALTLPNVIRLVLPVAQQDGVDAVRAGVGRQGTRPRAEHRPAVRHDVELHDPLGDVERVVVGQARHARAEPDAFRADRERRERERGSELTVCAES